MSKRLKSIRFRDSDYNDGTAQPTPIFLTPLVVGPYGGTVDERNGTPNVVISPEGMIINWLSIPADIGRKDAVVVDFPERERDRVLHSERPGHHARLIFWASTICETDNNGDDDLRPR